MLFYALPVALLVAHQVIFRPDRVILWIAFLSPLSISLEDMQQFGGIGVSVPTEPILFGLMVFFILSLISGKKLDRKFLRHPVSIAFYFYFGWIAITAITSSMPVVSIKFLISRMWFILVMYFMAHQLFRDRKYFEKFIWSYIAGMIIVVIYTLIRHSAFGFDEQSAHWVMTPFFKDHTSYGAALALFYPIFALWLFAGKVSPKLRLLLVMVFGILTIAIVLSYTRAAWLSIIVALAVGTLIWMRIRFTTVLILGVVLVGLFFSFQNQILMTLERNRQDSSNNFGQHVESMTNISSDASNLERLNRWHSALRLFEQRPFFGWGPGTYMFKYGTFQINADRTIISTNMGTKGNAHSEFLGPLAESGFIGMLTVIALVIVIIYTGICTLPFCDDRKSRTLVLAAVLGFITYFVHGTMTDFLDMDKCAVPIWAFTSFMVAMDLKYRRPAKERDKRLNETELSKA